MHDMHDISWADRTNLMRLDVDHIEGVSVREEDFHQVAKPS